MINNVNYPNIVQPANMKEELLNDMMPGSKHSIYHVRPFV